MNDKNKKENLQRSTLAYTAWIIIRSNVKAACKNIWVVFGAMICLVLAITGSVHVVQNNYSIALSRALGMVAIWALYVWALFWMVLAYGHYPRALRLANGFIRAGVLNRAGEPPLLTHVRKNEKGVFEYEFFSRGLSMDEWEAWKAKIESSLNVIILGFREGESKQYMVLQCVGGEHTLPKIAEWPGLPGDDKDTEILIGQGYVGPVTIDLAKIPHWLIGGATGCGKSRLLAGMMLQMIMYGFTVYLVDAKDGMDYGFARSYAEIIRDREKTVDLLEYIVTEMDERREILKRAEVHNIDEYNIMYPQRRMHRICIVIDEASSVFDAQASNKEEKAIIAKITHYVTYIARLARFVGIHLVIATQRPDVNSVPGSVKANLTGRIAGHCADDQASITILDDGSATEIPVIPGRFLVRDGGLTDFMAQAYLLDEEMIDAELRKHFLKNTVEVH